MLLRTFSGLLDPISFPLPFDPPLGQSVVRTFSGHLVLISIHVHVVQGEEHIRISGRSVGGVHSDSLDRSGKPQEKRN